MAVRLSGMVSGLDTDALVKELTSAYSKKKDSVVKKQTSLEWKTDAWKSMNTKIYSFYSKSLSNMRLSGSYNKKSASVSNNSVATVSAATGAVNGTQELKVKSLATSGYLTGSEISQEDGSKVTTSTSLKDIKGLADFAGSELKLTVNGKEETITLSEDAKINDLVGALKNKGINASFDEANNRFFISSKTSGATADFKLVGSDDNGNALLDKLGISDSTAASRIYGSDSEIELNGATFKSNTNNFSINGLTITAKAVTGNESVSITTTTDVDGVYNMIKDFITSYNELITDMDKAYNAPSAKGYEPLTDDEKETMSDSDIEKWETKVKDALLRKDSTLGDLSTVMKSLMGSTYEINGKKMSLASFGIKTAGYFASADNEKGVFHIDGDADDSKTSGNADKLREAIANDPESVVEFFSKLSTDVYSKLTQKMGTSTMSSAYTVYNDKQMKKQVDQYKKDVKTWEEKIQAYEDRYYKQFAAMEKALSSLNSQTSSLTSLFGN